MEGVTAIQVMELANVYQDIKEMIVLYNHIEKLYKNILIILIKLFYNIKIENYNLYYKFYIIVLK